MTLQVEPEFRLDTEPVPKAKGRVAGDGALAGDDLAHSVGLPTRGGTRNAS